MDIQVQDSHFQVIEAKDIWYGARRRAAMQHTVPLSLTHPYRLRSIRNLLLRQSTTADVYRLLSLVSHQ